jgi:hypothetical protein
MPLDPNVLHPFVRVHIINMDTCMYLKKDRSDTSAVYNKESCSQIDKSKVIHKESANFLLPFSTNFFDMRIKGQNQCSWKESFVVNQPASHLLKESTVLLFEILECNTSLIEKGSELVTRELFYPVAWAYLRPLGTAHIHMSRTRLQLYRFKMNQKENRKA